MPRGDNTGPNGFGAMTGRGLGFCAGYDEPGYMHPGYGGRGYRRGGTGFGRGYAFGRGYRSMPGAGFGPGFGRGMGYRYGGAAPADFEREYYPYSEADERDYLKRQTSALKEQLEAAEKRLTELEESESSD